MKDVTEAEKEVTEGDLRKMTCEQDLLQRPDGSAMFNQGDTSVLAAVYGPAEVRINKESIAGATVEVLFKPKVGHPQCSDRLQEQLIKNTCETVLLSALHPRTLISFIIQEMQSSGSLLSCCINAACMAALDASLPMKHCVVAVTCIINKDGDILLDPDTKTEQSAVASMTFAFNTTDYNVVASVAKGIFSDKVYQKCLLSCRQAAKKISEFYRESITRKAKKNKGNE